MAPGKSKPTSIKIDEDVVESARIVAAITGESMTDLVSGILRPVLAKMEREAFAKRSKLHETKGGEK